jgi:hypothetical protein
LDKEGCYKLDTSFVSEEFKKANTVVLFNILLPYFQKFRRDGYDIPVLPPSVIEANKNYLSQSDEFLEWFEETFETCDHDEFLKTKDIYDEYKGSELFKILTKREQRKYNIKWITEHINHHPKLKLTFVKVHRPYDDDGVQKSYRNVLIGYKLRLN